MEFFTFKGKNYHVDEMGFLLAFEQWDENFAVGMAPIVKIAGGLTNEHWKIINFIRSFFQLEGRVPLVYKTCRENNLRLAELKKLFPGGYLRGACKLAGLSYRGAYICGSWVKNVPKDKLAEVEQKVYRVDVRGFLVDPSEWDEVFAINKAYDMKMPNGLTEQHWKIINFLRESFKKSNTIPTVYEICEEFLIDLEALENLFPDGYHRGAVKIAGLRVI